MIGLAKTVEAYGEAIDYDLMTRTGLTLRDWEGGSLDGRSLLRFVKGLGPDSAFFRAQHPEQAQTAAWVDGRATCALIAELIDTVSAWCNALAFKGTGKHAPRLEPYPRPWRRASQAQRFGAAPIPVNDFKDWYYGGTDGD